MYKTTVHIKGMHCRACELLVEDELSEIRGVQRVTANQRKGIAEVYHRKRELDRGAVARAIKAAGYELGKDSPRPLLSTNLADYEDLGIALIAVAILFLVVDKLGLFNRTFNSAGNFSSLPVVLLVGLTAGFSTCMALVGGLILGVSARYSEEHRDASPGEKFRPHLLFNVGRVVSFTVLGAVVGWVGSLFQLSALTLGLLTILVALVMLALGLQLTGIFPRLSNLSLALPSVVSRSLGLQTQRGQGYSDRNAALLGGLTFFLPCGFTQAMQLYAMSSGSMVVGAATMGVFAIGTAPGLLGIGGLTSIVRGAFARRFFKFAGVIVVFLALFNLSNGYNLTGWNVAPVASANAANGSIAKDSPITVQDGVQVVRMQQLSYGYQPRSFTVVKDTPVRWVIDSKDPGSCASTIVSAKLGIRKSLKPGENIIEFTPRQTGPVRFTCIMGMYSGTFNVVDRGGTLATGGNSSSGSGQSNGLELGAVPALGQPERPVLQGNVQVLKTTFTVEDDIQPSEFVVKAGQPVRFEIDVKENGQGCLSTIMIPGLANRAALLRKGQPIVFNFTPTQKGQYQITCHMGIPRGVLTVE